MTTTCHLTLVSSSPWPSPTLAPTATAGRRSCARLNGLFLIAADAGLNGRGGGEATWTVNAVKGHTASAINLSACVCVSHAR